jgi:hypothetical protein
MANALLLLVLIITIPRWAMTLAQVDSFTLWSIPVTAIGEGIALELGAYLLARTHNRCAQAAAKYRAEWETHNAAMLAQGKRNRKPEHDPNLKGYGSLMALFYVLFALTVFSQTPFIMSVLTGDPVNALLARIPLWAYSALLVISPELITVALARAAHYILVLDNTSGKETLIDKAETLIALFTTRITPRAPAGAPVDNPATESINVDPPEPQPRITAHDRRRALMDIVAQGTRPTYADLGHRFGVSATTIGKDMAAIKRNGDAHD